MANYKTSGGGVASKVVAFALGLVMGAAALFGVGYGTGLINLDKSDDSGEAEVMDNLVVSENESNGISVQSTSADVGSTGAESAYKLTATITPTYVTNNGLTWSIAWDTTWSGYNEDDETTCDDIYGDEWYYGDLSAVSISDYVSLSATSGSEIIVYCYQPFGNPLIITCTADDGSGCSATCSADHQSFIKSAGVTPSSELTLQKSSSSYVLYQAYAIHSTGTIATSYTLENFGWYWDCYYIYSWIQDNSSDFYNTPYWMICEETISTDSTLKVYNGWENFIKYNCLQSGYTYNSSMLIDFTNALKASLAYYSGNSTGEANTRCFCTCDGYVKDTVSGKTVSISNASMYLSATSLNNVPSVSVSSISLSDTNLVF